MLFYFELYICIITTAWVVNNTFTRRATLRLQLVWNIFLELRFEENIYFVGTNFRGEKVLREKKSEILELI